MQWPSRKFFFSNFLGFKWSKSSLEIWLLFSRLAKISLFIFGFWDFYWWWVMTKGKCRRLSSRRVPFYASGFKATVLICVHLWGRDLDFHTKQPEGSWNENLKWMSPKKNKILSGATFLILITFQSKANLTFCI